MNVKTFLQHALLMAILNSLAQHVVMLKQLLIKLKATSLKLGEIVLFLHAPIVVQRAVSVLCVAMKK